MPVITTNKICKPNAILRSKYTGTGTWTGTVTFHDVY